MRKKLFTSTLLSILAIQMYADDSMGLTAIGTQAPNVASYTPVVQALCLAIASVICIVGAYYAYYKMQNDSGDARRTIMTSVGSAICFVAMSTALPSFFGIDDYSSAGGGSSQGFGHREPLIKPTNSSLIGDGLGIPTSSIIPDIPPLDYPLWKEDPRYRSI